MQDSIKYDEGSLHNVLIERTASATRPSTIAMVTRTESESDSERNVSYAIYGRKFLTLVAAWDKGQFRREVVLGKGNNLSTSDVRRLIENHQNKSLN